MSQGRQDKGTATMGWIDRGIAMISPKWALHRMAAKQALVNFGYNDRAHERGGSGGMGRNASGESWKKQSDRMRAMWDARETVEHDWIGGALGRVVLYVCGELVCKSNTGDPEVDAAYDGYLHNWAGDEQDDDGFYPCDATGRHRLIKLVQLAFLAMLVDGDQGMQWIPGGETALDGQIKPPQLLTIEADRIGSPLDATHSETYIGGVTIDPELGRVTSYRVYQRTRQNQYINPRDVPPSNFLHLWDPNRGDEYRGRTHLLRLLCPARDMRETLDAESIAIKTQSQFSVLVGSKDPFSDKGVAAWTGQTKQGTPTQEAVWGKILKLAEGESFTGFQPSQRPTGSFLAYCQLRVRQMAISLGLTYGFLWDLASLGGVTARIEVRADERRVAYWQRLLVDRLLRRIRKLLLAHGVAYDGLPAHPRMNECKWHFGQRIVTDAGYEVQNDVSLLQNGLTDPDTLAVKYNDGHDFSDVLQRTASAVNRARDVATKTNTTIELLAGQLWPNATEQLAAREAGETPPPAPGSLESVGEKGAAQIVDLLTKVATGQMDRTSGIQTLVTVYGLLPEQAEAITPPQGVPPKLEDDTGAGIEPKHATPE